MLVHLVSRDALLIDGQRMRPIPGQNRSIISAATTTVSPAERLFTTRNIRSGNTRVQTMMPVAASQEMRCGAFQEPDMVSCIPSQMASRWLRLQDYDRSQREAICDGMQETMSGSWNAPHRIS